jgi:hypothetical protein
MVWNGCCTNRRVLLSRLWFWIVVMIWLEMWIDEFDLVLRVIVENTNWNECDFKMVGNGCYMNFRALLLILRFVLAAGVWLWMECDTIDIFWEFCPETMNWNEGDYKMVWNGCSMNYRVLLSILWFWIVIGIWLQKWIDQFDLVLRVIVENTNWNECYFETPWKWLLYGFWKREWFRLRFWLYWDRLWVLYCEISSGQIRPALKWPALNQYIYVRVLTWMCYETITGITGSVMRLEMGIECLLEKRNDICYESWNWLW